MRKNLTAKQLIERDWKFPTGHRLGYQGFVSEMKAKRQEQLEAWSLRRPMANFEVNDYLAAYQNYPPEEFSEPYSVPDVAYATHLNSMQKKYLSRFKNVRRAWSRVLRFLPEAMHSGDRLRVLEMSTAHGATLEVLRHFGHDVVGNDFSNDGLSSRVGGGTPLRQVNSDIPVENVNEADWPYKPIIDSLGLDVRLFDAGKLPYPFDAAEFDVVLCFDALEHYCHPKDWMKIVDEFVRISKKTVVVRINPIQRHLIPDQAYTPYVQKFYQAMLEYSKSGFRCIVTEAESNQPLYFKLMKISDK
ncbi:methyltransferase family protein [Litoreibacter meonggei]|uniref:Methyltransferase family protein n=1 Tax=Litoreibacter meonggei TaxID=1049199 RepID=A0A497X5Z7_9RHOB|nr:methyltransferase domain-containing protein [Litoreibacter meonggei]RLJ60738.1 methyltransferase family protein [Litoreibacter meonggei]